MPTKGETSEGDGPCCDQGMMESVEMDSKHLDENEIRGYSFA